MAVIPLLDFTTAIRHLRDPHQDNYPDIADKLNQANAIVMRFMKLTDIPDAWIVANSSPEVLDMTNLDVLNAQALTQVVLAGLYEGREPWDADLIPETLMRWASSLRDPTLA